MNTERRNDWAGKLTVVLVAGILTVWLMYANGKAETADERAHANAKDIATNIQCIIAIDEKVDDVKFMQRTMDSKIDTLLSR